MSEERRNHSMAVAEETITLCILYGLNPDTLFEAALLHDMTRGKTPREQRELADIYGGCVEEDFLSFSVTHGKTAAAMAKAMFDLEEEACLAIAYHTTGRAHMTLSEKILYVADYIEPTRRHIVCQEARRNFYAGLPPKREKREEWLDQCILSGINDTITHLHMQNRHVHVDTIQAKKAFETPKR
jgi:nicotinate-nucleotide adenylyltransferase